MSATHGEISLAVILFGGGLALGYIWAQHNGTAAVAQAKSDTQTCVAANAASKSAIGTLSADLADLKQRHDAAIKAGSQAIDDRDETIRALQAQLAQRRAAIVESAHESSDCAALASVAVCDVVARQLWPISTAPAGSRPPADH